MPHFPSTLINAFFFIGKGIVVTQSVSKGTLLFASKAYAIAFPSRSSIILNTNLITNETQKGTQVQCVIESIQKLKRSPSTAAELYALWAGPNSRRDEPVTLHDGVWCFCF